MANFAILKRYAQQPDVTSLPTSVLFSHTPSSLTIFDAYPKAKFHFLTLPRILSASVPSSAVIDVDTEPSHEPLTAPQMINLRILLKNKSHAKDLLLELREDALQVKGSIEEEMIAHYGFKWPIWMGFHAIPSMEHVHLHVMSADLLFPKHKKHYNSFHPKLGFFLHLDDVLSWFDADESFYRQKSALKEKDYEPLLKEDLNCFVCEQGFKTIPKLKEHLQEEWNKMAKKAKTTTQLANKKRKREMENPPERGDTSSTADPKQRDERPE